MPYLSCSPYTWRCLKCLCQWSQKPSRAVGRAPDWPTLSRGVSWVACVQRRCVSCEGDTSERWPSRVQSPPQLSPSRSTPGGSYPLPSRGAGPPAVVAALRRPCSGALRRVLPPRARRVCAGGLQGTRSRDASAQMPFGIPIRLDNILAMAHPVIYDKYLCDYCRS